MAHEEEALAALRRVAGAGGKDVVRLGLVKNLRVDVASGVVRFQFYVQRRVAPAALR